MQNYAALIITIIIFLIPHAPLHGDIVVTNDNMILNGKILEKKVNHVVLGNYHGTFTIERSQIKTMYETESFQEDVKIFQKMGKPVNESEAKINYQAGIEKLEGRSQRAGDGAIAEQRYAVFLAPFCGITAGKLGSVLPYGAGAALTGDINLNQSGFTRNIHPAGVRSEMAFFHSKKGVKQVAGGRVSAGPLWRFPFSIRGFRFDWAGAPVIGIGWYKIDGRSEQTSCIKWNIGCGTGPSFFIDVVVISPQIRFDYIYDGSVPMYGFGIGIGAGYRFSR